MWQTVSLERLQELADDDGWVTFARLQVPGASDESVRLLAHFESRGWGWPEGAKLHDLKPGEWIDAGQKGRVRPWSWRLNLNDRRPDAD